MGIMSPLCDDGICFTRNWRRRGSLNSDVSPTINPCYSLFMGAALPFMGWMLIVVPPADDEEEE